MPMGNTFHIRRHIVIRNRSERFGTRSGEFPAKEAWMRLTDGQVNRQEIHLDKIRKLCIVYHIFCFESSFFQSKLYMKYIQTLQTCQPDRKLDIYGAGYYISLNAFFHLCYAVDVTKRIFIKERQAVLCCM